MMYQLIFSIAQVVALSYVALLIWAELRSRTEFPKTGLLPIMLGFGGLYAVDLTQGLQLLSTGAPAAAGALSAAVQCASVVLLCIGLAAWLPRVTSKRVARKLRKELSAVTEAAGHAEQSRLEFMKSFSFDVRSLLNEQLNVLDCLPEDGGPFKRSRRSSIPRRLRQSFHSLTRLVDDYFCAYELESTTLIINPHRFNLRSRLELLANRHWPESDPLAPALEVQIEDSVPEVFLSDYSRIDQVLHGLARFLYRTDNPPKSLLLRAQVAGLDPESARVRFLLDRESGGFTAKQLGLVAGCLQQSCKEPEFTTEDSRLALSNCARIVQLMGGELGAQTDPALPAGFSFTLPLKLYHGAGMTAVQVSRCGEVEVTPLFAGRHVLVVDDNAVHREVARRLLEKLGCRVESAATANRAFALYADHHYDAIFMDCDMSDIDGFQATYFIRRYERKLQRKTPIIALTAHVLKETRRKCAQAGMNDFVSKPLDIEALIRVLEQHVGISEASGSILARPEFTAPLDPPEVVINEEDFYQIEPGSLIQ